jgi:glycosyltransferase involved in cell wall biosynthesis
MSKNKISVCFVSLSAYGYFDPSSYSQTGAGGAQRQLYLISKEISDDYDIHFIVGDYGQADTENFDDITLHKSFRPVGSSLKKPIEALKLFNTMKNVNADVYISRYAPYKSIVIYIIAKIIGKKFVINIANDKSVKNLQRFSPYLRRIYRHTLINSNKIIVQTNYQQQRLKEFAGVKSSVVPNGYTKTDVSIGYKNRSCFIWVGRLHQEQKRPNLFVELAKRVPEANFLLIGTRGTEQYREYLKKEITSIENMDYKFDVDPNKIHQYYQQSIALVNTSRYEGFPNTFLEAWRVGTPVLGLDVNPDRFLQQDETTDFHAGDLEILSQIIRKLNCDKEYQNRVSRTVKEEFEQKYSIDKLAGRYIKEIEDAVR